MSRERSNVQAPVHELIAARWSTRAFDERPVERDKLASCLEAARWAPSCYNDQPWRFLVTDRHRDSAAWNRLLACLSPGNQEWARWAPVLILTCATRLFAHNGQPNRWAQYDTGQAVMSLCLQATALGLFTHQMGGFDAEQVRQVFTVPDAFVPMSVIALGYRADPAILDDALREREQRPRQRIPLEEIVFVADWQTAFSPPCELGWEARYQETPAEALPWYRPDLDPDFAAALERLRIDGGRILDLGTGPGTQAVALAKRGFQVVATDVSATALAQARALAEREGVTVDWVLDDILATRLKDRFDLIMDRGLFHNVPPEQRDRYLAALKRLLRSGGYLLLKCFSSRETRPEGPPHRFSPEEIQRIFGADFQIIDLHESVFQRPGETDPPKALFCILRNA